MFLTEQAKQVQVKGTYDVIVVGGGIAGISAALAAARTGAKTLLIEKGYMLGGLATAGLVTIYLPLCDGLGNQVSFGIAEELFRLSIKHGHEAMDASAWLDKNGDKEERKKQRYKTRFNANVCAILCEQLLLETGVEILYGTPVCAAQTENERITAIITENKSGREAYQARNYVDATGDADLCYLAGENTETFKQGNVLASWYYEYVENEYRLHMLGFSDTPDKYKTEEKKKNDTRKRYVGLSGKELSEMTCSAHQSILTDFLKNGNVNEQHALATIATTPQVRMTRRMDGIYTMNDEESHTHFIDSVGMFSDWRKKGPVYELPMRCLYGKKIRNVYSCGRCISVTDDMWDITRVIPVCAVSGQAAGTAAAMFDGTDTMDMISLQEKLKADGVKLHLEEL